MPNGHKKNIYTEFARNNWNFNQDSLEQYKELTPTHDIGVGFFSEISNNQEKQATWLLMNMKYTQHIEDYFSLLLHAPMQNKISYAAKLLQKHTLTDTIVSEKIIDGTKKRLTHNLTVKIVPSQHVLEEGHCAISVSRETTLHSYRLGIIKRLKSRYSTLGKKTAPEKLLLIIDTVFDVLMLCFYPITDFLRLTSPEKQEDYQDRPLSFCLRKDLLEPAGKEELLTQLEKSTTHKRSLSPS